MLLIFQRSSIIASQLLPNRESFPVRGESLRVPTMRRFDSGAVGVGLGQIEREVRNIRMLICERLPESGGSRHGLEVFVRIRAGVVTPNKIESAFAKARESAEQFRVFRVFAIEVLRKLQSLAQSC